MKQRLGELLLARGWIHRADLGKALETQKLLGGRLGTCLLDQGVLGEDLLAAALAEQHGVEAAATEELRHPPEEVAALLPRKLAVRWRAVPFRAHGNRLDVAMADPGDLAFQDELSFAASRRVQVFVAPEVRIAQGLARAYGEPAPARLAALADRLDRGRRPAPGAAAEPAGAEAGRGRRTAAIKASEADALFAEPGRPAEHGGTAGGRPAGGETWGGESPAGAAADATTAPAAAAARPPRPPRPTIVTLSEEERAALFGAPRSAAAAAAVLAEPEELGFEQAVERLERAEDRDEVGRVLLSFFGHHFDRVLLLGVRRDATTGWLAAGEGVDTRRAEALAIPFDRPSIFLNLRQGSAFHLGPLPPLPAHKPLVALLGGERPRECLLLPLRVGGRLVAAVYADRGGDRLAGLDLEALRRLTDLAGAALERAILLKRQEKGGAARG